MSVNAEAVTDDADWPDLQDTSDDEPDSLTPETVDGADDADSDGEVTTKRRRAVIGALVYGLLPGLALLLALGAGYLKWQDSSVRDSEAARIESVQAARDSTVALLSYHPDSVDKDLSAARDRLTGSFRDSYISLTNDVVIPGAKQKQISAAATVPAAASVSADEKHAVALVFVNQSTTVGNAPPTDTASAVKVTLDKVGDRWLISGFDPV